MRRSAILVASLTGLMAVACGDPPTPAETRSKLKANLPALVQDLCGSVSSVGTSDTMTRYQEGRLALNDAFAGVPMAFPDASADCTYTDETAQDLDHLIDTVFADANDEGDGVYRVRGADLCSETDLDCIRIIDEAEIRIRVEIDGDTVELMLLVGPDRAAPLIVAISPSSLVATVDLAQARAAIVHLAAVAGEDVQLPSVMEGRVALSLIRDAPLRWTIAFAVRQAVRVVAAVTEGEVAFDLAASDPIASLALDGVARELTASLDVGAVKLTGPWKTFNPTSLAAGTMKIDWKGLTGTLRIRDGSHLIQVGDISFGEGVSTIDLDDHNVWSFSMTPFDMSIDVSGGTAQPVVSFSPPMSLRVGMHLQPLADAGDYVEPGQLDDDYQFESGLQVQPVGTALQVLEGTLSIGVYAGQTVSVPAGQCLWADDPVTEGEHPVIGQFAARDCPPPAF